MLEGISALESILRFVEGLFGGNIPILSDYQPEKSPQKSTRSRDVFGSHNELRPNSRLECSK